MQVVLCNGAARSITRSIVTGRPITFGKFRIGKTVGFTPSPSSVDVDEFVYEGPASKIDVNFGSNPYIGIIEMTLDSNVGDFEIGNVMVYDADNLPFAYGVRNSVVPKLRTRNWVLGTELNLQMPFRVLTNETPANVDVLVTKESSLPILATEEEVIASPAVESDYSVYIVENFKQTGRPALLYADSDRNVWWANAYFEDSLGADLLTISGGIVGDKYSLPEGKVIYGGVFGDNATVSEVLSGGNFNDNLPPVFYGGLTF